MQGKKYYDEYMTDARECFDLPVFAHTRMWLDRYFAGEFPPFFPKMNPRGTEFQRLVWSWLSAIPYGGTITYGRLATQIAAVRGQAQLSAQAVGHAVGRNPISILVPCHRVVGARGALTGYAGGIEAKQWLLAMERRYTKIKKD